MAQYCNGYGKENNEKWKRAVVFMALLLTGLLPGCAMRKDSASRPQATPSPPAIQAAVPTPAATASKAPAPQALPPQKNNPKDGAAMILIAAGDFLMGSPEHKGDSIEKPQHRVYLDAYYISKYEVTNGQFRRFISESGYDAEGSWKDYALEGRDTHPVVCVTWNDAKAYCEWAGGSLPTEAQWEKAARGVDGRVWPWGNKWDGTECNWGKGPKVAGKADIWKGRGTAPVGSFPAGVSPCGVHDMAGNVAEWCGDWFSERYYLESPSDNPGGPASGQTRVIRFGNWFSGSPEVNRCASREGYLADRWLNFLGFRVVLAATLP
ncbi:MAG: formylglycine-generating enzyme family protein [Candidatus Eremiobacteraeota bacterium]|nr:formylglycine-generating enzyme family protein [Candidatus Eremiobacteraeota bacterium]